MRLPVARTKSDKPIMRGSACVQGSLIGTLVDCYASCVDVDINPPVQCLTIIPKVSSIILDPGWYRGRVYHRHFSSDSVWRSLSYRARYPTTFSRQMRKTAFAAIFRLAASRSIWSGFMRAATDIRPTHTWS